MRVPNTEQSDKRVLTEDDFKIIDGKLHINLPDYLGEERWEELTHNELQKEDFLAGHHTFKKLTPRPGKFSASAEFIIIFQLDLFLFYFTIQTEYSNLTLFSIYFNWI